MERRVVLTAVERADADEDIGRRTLRIFDDDVEVCILVEYPRIEQFVLGIEARARGVHVEQFPIWEGALRILVERPHVRVRRQVVEVVVELLDVLAVIALMAAEAEEALLENRVCFVPESRRETQALLAIGDSEDAVFAPAIRARTRVLERKILPCVAVGAVVFANGSPLPIAEIRSPQRPRLGAAFFRQNARALEVPFHPGPRSEEH